MAVGSFCCRFFCFCLLVFSLSLNYVILQLEVDSITSQCQKVVSKVRSALLVSGGKSQWESRLTPNCKPGQSQFKTLHNTVAGEIDGGRERIHGFSLFSSSQLHAGDT